MARRSVVAIFGGLGWGWQAQRGGLQLPRLVGWHACMHGWLLCMQACRHGMACSQAGRQRHCFKRVWCAMNLQRPCVPQAASALRCHATQTPNPAPSCPCPQHHPACPPLRISHTASPVTPRRTGVSSASRLASTRNSFNGASLHAPLSGAIAVPDAGGSTALPPAAGGAVARLRAPPSRAASDLALNQRAAFIRAAARRAVQRTPSDVSHLRVAGASASASAAMLALARRPSTSRLMTGVASQGPSTPTDVAPGPHAARAARAASPTPLGWPLVPTAPLPNQQQLQQQHQQPGPEPNALPASGRRTAFTAAPGDLALTAFANLSSSEQNGAAWRSRSRSRSLHLGGGAGGWVRGCAGRSNSHKKKEKRRLLLWAVGQMVAGNGFGRPSLAWFCVASCAPNRPPASCCLALSPSPPSPAPFPPRSDAGAAHESQQWQQRSNRLQRRRSGIGRPGGSRSAPDAAGGLIPHAWLQSCWHSAWAAAGAAPAAAAAGHARAAWGGRGRAVVWSDTRVSFGGQGMGTHARRTVSWQLGSSWQRKQQATHTHASSSLYVACCHCFRSPVLCIKWYGKRRSAQPLGPTSGISSYAGRRVWMCG